jgi:hypothetical protein
LSDEEFLAVAQPQLLKLCKSTQPDAYHPCFTDRGLKRLILFEFWLPQGDFAKSLKQICLNRGEETFFLTSPKPISSDPPKPYWDWELSFDNLDKLEKFTYPYRYTIFSKEASWAIVADIELHAIMTCTEEIYDFLTKNVPGIEQQIQEFFIYYNPQNWISHPPDVSWIPDMLSHVYGDEKAITVMEENEFPIP